MVLEEELAGIGAGMAEAEEVSAVEVEAVGDLEERAMRILVHSFCKMNRRLVVDLCY